MNHKAAMVYLSPSYEQDHEDNTSAITLERQHTVNISKLHLFGTTVCMPW